MVSVGVVSQQCMYDAVNMENSQYFPALKRGFYLPFPYSRNCDLKIKERERVLLLASSLL